MKVRAFYPVTLTIDGEEIVLRIKRLTMEEHGDFSARFTKLAEPTSHRFISRASTGPEQKQNNKGEYVIPLAKIAEKRLEEMDAEKRAEYDAAVKQDMQTMQKFIEESFEKYVTVEKGLIEELADGSEVSVNEGVDLFRIYGARIDVLLQVLEALRIENAMNEDQKKAYRSPIASSPSSKGRRRARAGRRRNPTVKNAATGDSAGNGDAKQNPSGPSGSTGSSSSSDAPSLN